MLDGAIRIPQLVEHVDRMGMSAVALTDNANMFGAVQLVRACEGTGVKPILGCEVNFTAGDRRVFLGCFLVGSSRVDLQACKLEYSIVSPK